MQRETFVEIHARWREIETEVVSETDGKATYVETARLIRDRLCSEFSPESVGEALLDPLLVRGVRQAVSIRSIEKADEDQADLFSSAFLDATVKIDEATFCHVRDANWDVLVAAKERSRKVLQRHIAKAEKMEERMRLLAGMGMADDPSLTVVIALRIRDRRIGSTASTATVQLDIGP